MRFFILVFICTAACFSTRAQSSHSYMTWLNAEVEGDVIGRLSWSGSVNARFNSEGLKTFFPQVGLEYKVKKWFRPSLEYRFVLDKNKYDNYKASSSIRANLNFRHVYKKRLKFGARLRYQYSFKGSGSTDYDEDFDQAIRLKPYAQFDINDFPLTPFAGTELFFDLNPRVGSGPVSKLRYTVGLALDSKSDHTIKVRYLLDQRFASSSFRHVLGISYKYEL